MKPSWILLDFSSSSQSEPLIIILSLCAFEGTYAWIGTHVSPSNMNCKIPVSPTHCVFYNCICIGFPNISLCFYFDCEIPVSPTHWRDCFHSEVVCKDDASHGSSWFLGGTSLGSENVIAQPKTLSLCILTWFSWRSKSKRQIIGIKSRSVHTYLVTFMKNAFLWKTSKTLIQDLFRREMAMDIALLCLSRITAMTSGFEDTIKDLEFADLRCSICKTFHPPYLPLPKILLTLSIVLPND